MRKRVAAAALLLAAACVRPPVQEQVTIEFADDDTVVLTAQTNVETSASSSDAAKARAEAMRTALASGTDPWTLRFARLSPQTETQTLRKSRGVLGHVSRSVRIPTADLQQAFSDLNITVTVVEGEGWRELTLYPGTSARASREQLMHFYGELRRWSDDVAQYYGAIARLYAYMDRQPHRAEPLFAALLSERGIDGVIPAVAEDEQPLVENVVREMDRIAVRMDELDAQAVTFAEEADLVFNAFPARMVVRLPGEVLTFTGFTKEQDDRLVIEPVDLFASLGKLEGKWIHPDPLAAVLRDEEPSAAKLAAEERKFPKFVESNDISEAIRAELTRVPSYAVRWRN